MQPTCTQELWNSSMCFWAHLARHRTRSHITHSRYGRTHKFHMCVSNLRDSPAVRVAKREARGWKTLFENNSVQLRFHTRVQAGPTPALFAPISLKTHLGGPADWLIRQLTVRRRRDRRPGNHAVVAALFVTSCFLAHSPLMYQLNASTYSHCGLSLRVHIYLTRGVGTPYGDDPFRQVVPCSGLWKRTYKKENHWDNICPKLFHLSFPFQ